MIFYQKSIEWMFRNVFKLGILVIFLRHFGIFKGVKERIKEKISADHLLYVSLKYTKTGDIIINLLLRWKNMIDLAMDLLVEEAQKKKKWKAVPDAPRAKLVQLKKIYEKD